MTHTAIAKARQLHAEGKAKAAFNCLCHTICDGYADELRDELERLFPPASLDQDPKVRNKAAGAIARLGVGQSKKWQP